MRFLVPWALAGLLPALGVALLSVRHRGLLGRGLTLALLSVALAAPEVSVRRSGETVVFLVDRSASVGEAAVAVLGELVPPVAARGGRVGVVSFAGEARVTRWPGMGELPLGAPLPRYGTDVAAAIDLALALAGTEPTQLVLVSDGRATAGDTLAAAARARARGIPVHVRPVGQSDPVRLAEFRGPREAPLGTLAFDLTVEATRSATGTLLLYRGGVEVAEQAVELQPGRNRFSLADAPPGEGFHPYRAEVRSEGDPIPENNVLDWGVVVGEGARVLVVGPEPTAVDALLGSAGVEFRRKGALAPEDLAGVRLVILDDHPLGLLGSRTVEALRAFASGGGGLLVVQGRRAVAGYLGPVEDLLPVRYVVPERVQEATAAVIFVLDRSASMSALAGDALKIDLLKEAAAAAVEAMPDEDVVGAVAFDRYPYWLVRPGTVAEVRDLVFQSLRGLTASGGTDVYPALEQAVRALLPLQARIRHAIVISDGKTHRDEEILAWLRETVAREGIGITTIAVGADADLETLDELASMGDGRTYVLTSMADLRPLLVQETERVARPRFVERETPVRAGAWAFPLSTSLPPLQGYTLTFPKPTAEVAFLSPAGDPLLARWRLGLGEVAVLNADLAGIWTRDWLGSPALGELWGYLVGELWGERQELSVAWQVDGATLCLVADAASGGRWANGLELAGVLVGPGGSQPVRFDQTGPGQYTATLPAPPAGAYTLTLSEPGGRFGGTFAVTLPYPAELTAFGPDLEALRAVARVSGGELVWDEVLPPPPGAGRDWLPLGRALLWAAACSFLLDLALRKLLG